MSRQRWIIGLTLILVGVLAIGAASVTAGAPGLPQTGGETLRTITVGGQGTARTEPDLVVLSLGVEAEAETADEAFDMADEQIQDVIDALIDADIPEEEIQTQSLQLRAQREVPREPEAGVPEVVGFVATHILEVRVEDLDRVGEVITTAVNAGANTAQNIDFRVADPGAARDEALANAFEDARSRAQVLARLAEAELGQVLVVTSEAVSPFPVGIGGQLAVDEAAAIQPGQETVTARVQVTWALVGADGAAVTPTTPAPDATPTDTTPQPTPTGETPEATTTETPTDETPEATTTGTPTDETPEATPTGQTTPATPGASEATDAAREALAEELDLDPEDIVVASSEEVEWANGCLELPEPDEACTEAITPGWRIRLMAGGSFFTVHTDLDGEQVRIEE